MAYSLGDLFRPLRTVMRINGSLLGLGGGLSLLLLRQSTLVRLGILSAEAGWPLRFAGAALIGIGLFLLLSANERFIELPALIVTVVTHALFALVLFFAYLNDEFMGLNVVGQLFLVLVFFLCLVGALVPLRYFQAEYRPY